MHNRLSPVFALAVWFIILLSWTLPGELLRADDGNLEPAAAASDSIQRVKKRIEALEARIVALKRVDSLAAAHETGLPPDKLAEHIQKLEAIHAVQERLLTAMLKGRSQIDDPALSDVSAAQPAGNDLPDKPPYNLSQYDGQMEQLTIIDQQISAVQMAGQLSRNNLIRLREQIQEAEKAWRGLNEQLARPAETDDPAQLRYELNRMGLEKEFLRALVDYETVNLENMTRHTLLLEKKQEATQRQVDRVAQNLKYDEADLARQLELVQGKKKALELKLESLSLKAQKADLAQHALRNRTAAAENADGSRAALEAEAAALKSWSETYQLAREMTGTTIQLLTEQRDLWQTRYRLLKEAPDPTELGAIRAALEERRDEWSKRIGLEQQQALAIRARMTSLERRTEDDALPDDANRHLQNEIKALRQLSEERTAYTLVLMESEQLTRRTLDQLTTAEDFVGFWQQVQSLYRRINGLWDIEIWVIDDNPVTVKEAAVALLVLVVGIAVMKILLRALGRRLFAVANIKQTTAATIHKLISYFTYLLVALFAMRMVNIPLAAFAFLGGAIAIGLGFGAQNLINNFISGFIMLAERPISISDLIEIDGVVGQVEEIGARCTRIRTGENIHILVPNSAFLEKNITNWTLSDHNIRTKVTVGVIYGSPVDETRRLLLKAVHENERVIQTPEPFVLFQDFGDNALIFDVFFWIRVNKIIERRSIESSVRFTIDDLFRKAGLVIAFPQRDIHLDTQKPLELKFVK